MYVLLSIVILTIIGILLYSYYYQTNEMFKTSSRVGSSSSKARSSSAPHTTTTTTTTVIQQPRSSYPFFIPFWSTPVYYDSPVAISTPDWVSGLLIFLCVLTVLLIFFGEPYVGDSMIVTSTTTTTTH